MTVPTRCWLVVCRTDCFCPEKSTEKLHLTERDAKAECAAMNEEYKGVCSWSVVPCMIMPEETFYEIAPDWRKPGE